MLNNEETSDEEVESLHTHLPMANQSADVQPHWQKAVLTPTLLKPRHTMSRGFVFYNIFLLIFREMKGEGDRDINQLPPGHETETWAYALTGTKPVISWCTSPHSTTELHRPGRVKGLI